ncbi:hypothetical protein TMatcc_007801 [Talaromyces marneffei ATCC 18224]
MSGQVCANITGAVDHIKDACRETGFSVNFCKGFAVKGRKFTGIIPSSNAHTYTKRRFLGIHPRIFPQLSGLSIQATTTYQIGKVFKHIRARRNIYNTSFTKRFPRIMRFGGGYFIVLFAQKLGSFL